MTADHHVAVTQFAGDDLHALVCVRIFDSEQVGWKQFAEAPVNLTDGVPRDGATL